MHVCLINALAFLFQCLGNHEFDNGVAGLIPFVENVTSPILCANIELDEEPELKKLHITKSTVLQVNGVPIGVIGYLTPDTQFLAVKSKVKYMDEIDAIKKEVKKLQSMGVNIIIALGHSGYTKDMEIAKEIEGIDLVVGAHSHTMLWTGSIDETETPKGEYPTFIKQSSGRIVPVVQAYAFTKYLGRLRINFNSEGEIVHIVGQPILLDKSVPQDPDLLELVECRKENVENISSAIVGESKVFLDGASCRRNECNLGNLIADSLVNCYSSNYQGRYWTDAPIALMQGGGIRASLNNRNITTADMLTVLPFDGQLATITLNGTTLLDVFEHSVASYDSDDDPGEFLQVSGIKVTYDLKNPTENRVIDIETLCSDCDIPKYDALEKDKNYTIIVSDYIANGGDGYSMLKSLPNVVFPYTIFGCATEYVTRHSPLQTKLHGRIIIKNNES